MSPVIIRIRGLPYSATADDVIDFFKDVNIKGGKRGISFPQGPNGRSNGEAYIELEEERDVDLALAHHRDYMGRRFIEVYRSDEEAQKRAMGWQPERNRNEFFARLRGLPYDTEKKDIYNFFGDLTIEPNGIGLLVDHLGRCTGDAYVQFTSEEMLARAKEKHLEKIGRRYIEIFDATGLEASMAIRKQHEINRERSGGGIGPMMRGRGGYEGGGRGGNGYYGNGGPPLPPGPPPPPPPPYRGGGGYGNYGYGDYGYGPRGPSVSRPGPYSRPPPPPGQYGDQYGGGRGGGVTSPSMQQRGGHMDGPVPPPGDGGHHSVHMRGLPFQATRDDVMAFFAPLRPLSVVLRYNQSGRPTGEADAEFATHEEARQAMRRDRERIGTRYIELFLDSTPAPASAPPPAPLPPFYGGSAPPQPSAGRFNGGGPRYNGAPSAYYDAPPNGSGAGYYGGSGAPQQQDQQALRGAGDYGYGEYHQSGYGMMSQQQQGQPDRNDAGGRYDQTSQQQQPLYGSGIKLEEQGDHRGYDSGAAVKQEMDNSNSYSYW